MIDATTIQTAERMLKLVAGDGGIDVPRQFAHYAVDRQAYENFHQEMMSLLILRTQQRKIHIPKELVPILNTLMAHHFLVGVACGRQVAEVVT